MRDPNEKTHEGERHPTRDFNLGLLPPREPRVVIVDANLIRLSGVLERIGADHAIEQKLLNFVCLHRV